jgi:UDP-GlcNAc3NAcA epimerase
MKIVSIVGARPQFIKAAVLSRQFLSDSNIEEVIIHTGQHFDINMSDVFFDEMKIPRPNYFLDINGLNHGAMTGQMIEKIEALGFTMWSIRSGFTNGNNGRTLQVDAILVNNNEIF